LRNRRAFLGEVKLMNRYAAQFLATSMNEIICRAARAVALALLSVAPFASAADIGAEYDLAAKCDNCENWNQPVAPFKIHGNTFYVGVHGLSAVLITTSNGLILLDGDLPQSAPLIEANVRSLGFRVEDIRFILNSHVHTDHAGGIAALQRHSGAEVIAGAEGAAALQAGHMSDDDPLIGYNNIYAIPRVARVKTIGDGETVTLGDTAVVAHRTPGHTPGGTTWSWRSCEQDRCIDVVYADSLNAISFPGFRFTGGHGKPDLTPTFRASIAKVAALPCDILITVHPDMSHVFERAAKTAKGHLKAFIDQGACRAYAAAALRTLNKRAAKERAGG
jgi:metallo-beta-lactamase class B